MSYPFDNNPWDEPAASQNQNASQNPAYSAYGGRADDYAAASGYTNPLNQYPDSASSNYNSGYDYQAPDPYANPGFDYSNGQEQVGDQMVQQAEQQQQQQQQPPPGDASFFRKFVDRHLPFCGPVLNSLSAISLPLVEKLAERVNKDLLVSKMFYFFFYSAFGSLFPLMGVYFKQAGMNPAQVGILTGIRPFIEIFSAPFWHSLADRFHKSKALLIFSLISWIVFTYSLAHIRPPASACIAFNDTDYVLYVPYSSNDLSNYIDVQSYSSGIISSAPNTSASSGNEIFISKPSNSLNEGGTSGRLRRRRSVALQLTSPSPSTPSSRGNFDRPLSKPLTQYEYKLDISDSFDHEHKLLAEKPFELDLDFENDFVDQPAAGSQRADILRRLRRTAESSNEKDYPDQEESETSDTGKSEPEEEPDREPSRSPEKSGTSSIRPESELSSTPASSFTSSPAELAPSEPKKIYRNRHKTPPTHIVGMSPITVEYAVNYNKEKHSQLVTPMFSTIVYKLDDIKSVFFLLLLLIGLGEFFSAPALTLADSATLRYLGADTDSYGRQRMFGSLSWAITLLLVGMALDNSTSIADHPCGPHIRERSYTVCFIIFSMLMALALLTATQFRFDYPVGGSVVDPQGQYQQPPASTAIVTTSDLASGGQNKIVTTATHGGLTNYDEFYEATQPRSIFNTAPPINMPAGGPQGREKFEFLDKWKSAVFAQSTWQVPEWVNVFRQFRNPLHLTYLFITWFLGCGVGLVFTFLFWHLQDVGGTPTIFGICSVINHISEIFAYFFSFSIIKRFGHTKVLSVGLGCNTIRFLYVAFLTNPYYALPFELVQGITHSACFAACCSYISHKSKPELKTSTQGVMQGLHHGIGRACGALLGGYMINAIGSRASFCIYGLLSGCVLAGFLQVRKRATEAEVKVEDDSNALGGYGAPQGVPAAIPNKMSAER